jgi:hypothetical protein
MNEIVARAGELGTPTGPKPGGDTADERRLSLLRQIAEAGGTITPTAEPLADRGHAFMALGDDVDRDLSVLARRNYLEERFFDRVSLCPKCNSHHLNVREICPSCRRSHLASEGLLHHFRCGYVGIPAEFLSIEDGGYICPKCKGKMHHLGTEYDRLGKAFVCRSCGVISETPPVEAVCLACGARTPADSLVSALLFSYILTSRGAAAIQRGALFDGDEELVSIAGAPVLRRAVILEFLDHEMKRLQLFKSTFSVLLAKCDPAAIDESGDDSKTQWLTRLRHCLRDVDLVGQLADALYVVVLPQTKRRAADAIRQTIASELGPHSPLTLSTVEISEPAHLAQVLAGLNT